MTPEQIAALAGAVLSLVLAYVPRLKTWYEALDGDNKRLVMGGLLLAVTAGLLAYQCRGDGACYAAQWETALGVFIAALVGNQGAYLLAVHGRSRA